MAQGRSFHKLTATYPVISAIGSATVDPINLIDGAGESFDVTATGCVLGDFAVASFGVDTVDLLVTATVTAANTVTVRLQNESTATQNLLSTTLRVLCFDLNAGASAPA